jgi:hypothetical protein
MMSNAGPDGSLPANPDNRASAAPVAAANKSSDGRKRVKLSSPAGDQVGQQSQPEHGQAPKSAKGGRRGSSRRAPPARRKASRRQEEDAIMGSYQAQPEPGAVAVSEVLQAPLIESTEVQPAEDAEPARPQSQDAAADASQHGERAQGPPQKKYDFAKLSKDQSRLAMSVLRQLGYNVDLEKRFEEAVKNSRPAEVEKLKKERAALLSPAVALMNTVVMMQTQKGHRWHVHIAGPNISPNPEVSDSIYQFVKGKLNAEQGALDQCHPGTPCGSCGRFSVDSLKDLMWRALREGILSKNQVSDVLRLAGGANIECCCGFQVHRACSFPIARP